MGVIKNNKPKNIIKIGKRKEGDKVTPSLLVCFLEVILLAKKNLGEQNIH